MLKVPITEALRSSDWFTNSTRGKVGGACKLPQLQSLHGEEEEEEEEDEDEAAADVFSFAFAFAFVLFAFR
jgi:hypothetical protein